MDENERLTELLCSRLCHDLISPLGAITNGVELVADGDRGALDDALGLIGASARQGAARLSYFRLALGAGGTEAGTAFGTIRKAIDDYFEERKLKISWTEPVPMDSSPFERQFRKLVMNLMIVAGECAQRNATIAAAARPDAPKLTISVKGTRCVLRDDVRTGFDSTLAVEAMTVRNVVAWNCRRIVGALGLQLAIVEDGQTSVDFTVS